MAVWIDFSTGVHVARRGVLALGPIMAPFWLLTLTDSSPRTLTKALTICDRQMNRPGFCDCCGYWLTASRAVGF